MIKIRLARNGRKKLPIYSIVAINSANARDGQFLDKIGQYDPQSKELIKGFKKENFQKWVSQGAQVTDTVRTLLKKTNNL